MYVKNGITFKLRDDISLFVEGHLESVFIEVTSNKKNTVLGEIYRVPGTYEDISLEHLDDLFSKLQRENKKVIIGRDKSFDYLKVNTQQKTSDLLELSFGNVFFCRRLRNQLE